MAKIRTPIKESERRMSGNRKSSRGRFSEQKQVPYLTSLAEAAFPSASKASHYSSWNHVAFAIVAFERNGFIRRKKKRLGIVSAS